jgi:hypothetical protein
MQAEKIVLAWVTGKDLWLDSMLALQCYISMPLSTLISILAEFAYVHPS